MNNRPNLSLPMTIRAAQLADCAAIARVQVDSYLNNWAVLRSCCRRKKGVVEVAYGWVDLGQFSSGSER